MTLRAIRKTAYPFNRPVTLSEPDGHEQFVRIPMLI